MGKLIRIVLLAAFAWSIYWAIAAWGLRAAVTGWFDAQEARGWQAEYADIELEGFPLRHVTTLRSPALADPRTGVAWRAETLRLQSPAIWPGHVTLRFPATPQRLSHYDDTLELAADAMIATMHLDAGLALEIDTLSLTAGPWSVRRGAEAVAQGAGLVLGMQRQTDPRSYALTLDLPGLVPGPRLREIAAISDRLPDELDSLELRMSVTFDKPWDRSALETSRPQPRHVDIGLADARWGAMRVLAAGEFDVSEAGVPEGSITLKVDNWRELLEMARQSGALPPEAVGPAERALGLLSGMGGNPNALDARITLRGGYMALGPIPIGPAPRLVLR